MYNIEVFSDRIFLYFDESHECFKVLTDEISVG